MEAISTSINNAKRVLQVNVAPRFIAKIGPAKFATELRRVADLAKTSKSSGEVQRVVVIVDGTCATESGSSALKALSQLFSLEDCSLLDVVSTILLINADETLKAAWAIAKLVEPAKKYAPIVRVLE
jgi:hypothetical protein